ncbi:1-deoxy-D-xylulose 5-phosphate reductoisomerase [Gracilibacillus ureilyticus]|uniref:1-deoxy-D-xylulose 5-phosphate reductoisomerase n=1 Tax=Gracilibacillus ureilyticus TaxID=531814 RepID=A0A1H9L8G1_9BACI|nr:1-deoxy-D-xylulose-5-phosphate reductoisomerase [Gracilibacillus ureilyticus]SER07283.1 1-deoxy-D-xylulose 5-phosphate reductoisomerase [Gracilibacillus ureilyticus]
MKNITLLGATGSIGVQTLDVIEAHPEQFRLFAISFGENVEKALPIIKKFRPEWIVVKNDQVKQHLNSFLSGNHNIIAGETALEEISTHHKTDVVVNAVMGSVGLKATLSAIEQRKQVAIANKETLVTAGHLVMNKAKEHQVNLLPIDSEHSAIFQALNGESRQQIEKIILTASGGSFRDKSRDELKNVTVEDALNHPNWSMGAKITIDSATMMNKGLEVIEAHWLFNIPYEKIEVIQHKESIIHSMVEFVDYSVIAQLGTPDMRVPIQYALTYPERMKLPQSEHLDLAKISKLHFKEMDFSRFPCLKYAYEAGKTGGTMPAVLNAANEVAVELFLKGKINFLEIEHLVAKMLENHDVITNPDLETIQSIDKETRMKARNISGSL